MDNRFILTSVGSRCLMKDAFGCHKLLKLMKGVFFGIITTITSDMYTKPGFYFIVKFSKMENNSDLFFINPTHI